MVYEVGELSWLVFADDDVLLFHDGMTDEVEFEEFACEVGAQQHHHAAATGAAVGGGRP